VTGCLSTLDDLSLLAGAKRKIKRGLAQSKPRFFSYGLAIKALILRFY